MKIEIQPGRSRETRKKIGEVKEDDRFIFGISTPEKIDSDKVDKND